MGSPRAAMKSSPRSPQLAKACVQQRRPSAAKKKYIIKKKKKDSGFESQPMGSNPNLGFGWVRVPSELCGFKTALSPILCHTGLTKC